MSKDINVKKRNGRLESFDPEKINKCVERACKGLEGVSASEVVLDAQITFNDKVKTSEIDEGLILTAREKIYKNPQYSYVAARLKLNCLYKEVFKESVDCDTFEEDYRGAFIKNIKRGVKEGIYSEKLLEYDLKELANYIDPHRDGLFKYHGIKNLYDRYFQRIDDKVVETPQHFHMRVAMGLCYEEENKEAFAKKLYDTYSNHLASPSTPTLFNSGTQNNQLSSCYLSEIDDSVNGIFDGLWQEARKSKHAGGLGFHVSKIRGTNAKVRGTNGKSSGLIPWLKVYGDMLIACDQGGRRKGSGCAYVEPWHVDIEDFIDLRKANGEERRRSHDINTALWICDLFMERVESDGRWTLFCPDEAVGLVDSYGEKFNKLYKKYEKMADNGEIKNFRIIEAKSLWKKILKALFETSHPWPTFKDNANLRYSNIHCGNLHGSNLCLTGDSKVIVMIDSVLLSTRLDDLVIAYTQAVKDGVINKHYENNKIKILSKNIETNEIEFKPLQAAALTKKNAKLLKVTDSDSGKSIKCTEDHKIFTKNRGYVMAKDLKIDDTLDLE